MVIIHMENSYKYYYARTRLHIWYNQTSNTIVLLYTIGIITIYVLWFCNIVMFVTRQ